MRIYVLDENGQVVFELNDLMEGGHSEISSFKVQRKVRVFISAVLQFLLKQKRA